MKAVLLHVDPNELAKRRRLGLDKFDEVWEGVLHMTPAPSYEHQRIYKQLVLFLEPLLVRNRRETLALEVNVLRADDDYRIPDISFIAAGHESIIEKNGLRGGPDAVIEIRSPDDESYDKLPFFAALGVREVVVIDTDTKKPEIFRLAGRAYVAVSADRDGWVASETLRVRFRVEASALAVTDDQDPTATARI